MIPSKKSFLIGLVVAIVFTCVPALFAANFSELRDYKSANSAPQGGSYYLFAELDEGEKFIYYADTEPDQGLKGRMTWEGILDTDSPARVACKKGCLANYGIDGKSETGTLCDDKGWNRCLAYMNKSFWPEHTDGCREDLRTECINCWQKYTQSCYDEAFAACISNC